MIRLLYRTQFIGTEVLAYVVCTGAKVLASVGDHWLGVISSAQIKALHQFIDHAICRVGDFR